MLSCMYAAHLIPTNVYSLFDICRASTGIAGLKAQYSSTKGFYLVVPEHQGRQQAAATSMHGRGHASSGSSAATPTQLPK